MIQDGFLANVHFLCEIFASFVSLWLKKIIIKEINILNANDHK